MSSQKIDIKQGDTVQIKGKHGKEIQGTVVSLAGRYCKVEQRDGSVETVLKKDVKNILETSTRRTARRTVRSQTRREAQKSQSQSSSRSKSRSRSRSRGRKIVPSPTRTLRKSIGNAVSAKQDTFTFLSPVDKEVLTRKSVRVSEIRSVETVRQSTPKPSILLSEKQQLAISSDSEPDTSVEKEKEKEVKSEPKKPSNIKAKRISNILWTALWLLQFLLLPAVAMLVRLTCTKNWCTITELPYFPKHWATYFDFKVTIMYIGWILIQAVLMFVPFGNIVKSFPSSEKNAQMILKYRLNGFIALFFNATMFGILAYLQQPLDIVHSKFLQLIVASIIFSYLFTFLIHTRQFLKRRKHLDTTSSQLEEVSFFGKMFNIRVYCYRLGMLAWVGVVLCLLYKSYVKDNILDYSLLLSAACQLFYVADLYWREETLLTTPSFQQEKLDYFMIIRLCTFVPFITSIPLMYIITYVPKTSQNWWLLSFALLLFVFGYWIYLKSSREQHIYLKNPHDPSIAYVKRILPSLREKQRGVLSRILHSSYFGEFLMHLSWTLPCGFRHIPPYIPAFLTLLYLIKEFVQVETTHNKEYYATLNKHQEDIH